MPRSIFVNMPVRDLPKSKVFFESLGFHFNPQFTDDNAGCLVISDTIYAMIMTHERFKDFLPTKSICDPKQSTQMLLALSCETREEVDTFIRKALAAGATTYKDATDHGFMYIHEIQDLDGHIWEFFYMDPSFVQK
jgi:uncharacterized protein